MTQKARHASSGMMLGQPVSCKNKWKSRITRRREPIFLAGKPVYGRVRVARVKSIAHGQLERFVVRRHRSILQTARDIKPAGAIFMHNVKVRSIIEPMILTGALRRYLRNFKKQPIYEGKTRFLTIRFVFTSGE